MITEGELDIGPFQSLSIDKNAKETASIQGGPDGLSHIWSCALGIVQYLIFLGEAEFYVLFKNV